MPNKIPSYDKNLKPLAQKLRQQGILAEVLLWKNIQDRLLGVEFHRQVPIDRYIVDFYCHEIKLVVEVDGRTHRDEETAKNDVVRQEKLESLGLRIIRFEDGEVRYNMMRVLMTLQDEVDALVRSAKVALNTE